MAKIVQSTIPGLISGTLNGMTFTVRNGKQYITVRRKRKAQPATAREKIARARFKAAGQVASHFLNNEPEFYRSLGKYTSRKCTTIRGYIAKCAYQYFVNEDIPDCGVQILPSEEVNIPVNGELIDIIRDYIIHLHPKF